MKNGPHTLPRWVIYSFFILGLISAVAFRAIVVIQKVEPLWVRPVWYIGAVGYLFFFLYRFYISRKRKQAIARYRLIEKVNTNACLTDEDREVVAYLLQSLRKSMEDRNYFIIFILSIVAIALDLLIS
ncbi:MAG: hypothetical protein D6726_02040 [Nitrospirae bacterium]|nr:MAG: hypothetical protein D6726_02040 [Nitrospirota bacterium]